jgi:hypothetical protein
VQIHGLYSRKIGPTVSIIHKEIKDSIKISKSKLTLTLIYLGYTYKKIGDNRRVWNDQAFAFTRGYFWGIRPIIRKSHIICAVILVNPCFIHVHDIIPCFPKRFDLSQIITPIIDNRHLIVQNSSIITYFFISISKINEQGMISCTWMKHGLTKITAQIICDFRMMGLMPQKYPLRVYLGDILRVW